MDSSGSRGLGLPVGDKRSGVVFGLVIVAVLFAGILQHRRPRIVVAEERLLAANLPALEAHRQGERAFAEGEFHEALRGFQTASRLEPKSALAHLNESIALTRLGRRKDALEALQGAQRLQPRWALAWVHAAHLHADERRLAEAGTAARKATELAPRAPEAWLARAHVSLLRDQPGASERHARRAVSLAPRSAPAWLAVGDALLRAPGRKRFTEAVAAFEKAVTLDANAYTHRRLGEALQEAGRLEPAIVSLQTAAELEPADPTHAYQLSLALRDAGRTRDAETWAERSRKLQESRYRRIALTRKAEQAPGDTRLQLSLARELCSQGDRSGGMRVYRQVLALEPENRIARKALAELEAGVVE